MFDLVSPEFLLDTVRARQDVDSQHFMAYWIAVGTSRERFVEELRRLVDQEPIVAVPVREGFVNPNAVLTDFVGVLDANKESVCEQMSRFAETGRTPRFILVAKSELTVPQAASPVHLPTWFPRRSGVTVEVFLEDLTWVAEAPLGDNLVNVEEICELLFELDGVILNRIEAAFSIDHNAPVGLVDLFGNVDKEAGGVQDILAKARKNQRETVTPTAFRPSARGGSIVGRINVLAANVPVEKLRSTCNALARATALTDGFQDRFHESVSAVLGRPVTLDTDRRLRFSRNLILTIHHCCQLITAAAHADYYARYPVPLLKSLSVDLRRSLDSAIVVLKT